MDNFEALREEVNFGLFQLKSDISGHDLTL